MNSENNETSALVKDPIATPGDAGLAAVAAALDAEAKAVEAGPAAPGAPAPAAPTDWPAEAAELVTFATTLCFPMWPRLKYVYTPEAREHIAKAAAPLMAKYDFSLAAFFGKWAPEIGFAMVALPLVVPTVEAIKADRAERKAAKAAPPAAAAAAVADPLTADMLGRAAK